MSQTEKAGYYKTLKDAGVQFTKHYREYSTDELKRAVDKLHEGARAQQEEPEHDPSAAAAMGLPTEERPARMPTQARSAPRAERNPAEMPGQRLNKQSELDPIRTDDKGRVWYQEEVQKPSTPRPRGRRILKYMDTGTREETVQNGQYVETFEVAGDMPSRPSEVKITLPSYQVGIYKDPRFPFKIHTYGGREGFDLFEVQDYYGGAELVPAEIKRIYVENVLCYDIRTVVRAIQTEFRQLQLQGKVR